MLNCYRTSLQKSQWNDELDEIKAPNCWKIVVLSPTLCKKSLMKIIQYDHLSQSHGMSAEFSAQVGTNYCNNKGYKEVTSNGNKKNLNIFG